MPRTQLTAPFRGVNLNTDMGAIHPKEAEEALNVNLHKGTLRKRSGYTLEHDLSTVGKILGLCDYLKNDDTKPYGLDPQTILKVGTHLYKISGGSASEVGSSLGLSSTELASFCVANNRVYFCDSEVFKVTDGSNVYDAQITRPSSAPTVGEGTAGNLTGTYDYKITWYSSTWGQESPASDASSTIELTDKKAALTSLPTTAPDSRCDKKKIYRRKVSAFESEWTYVDEVATATASYDDDTKDEDLIGLDIAPLSYSQSLPDFRFLAYQADVLFAAGSDDKPTALYYTRAGMPWTMDRYLEVGSGHDTDRITGLAAFQGIVVVFKERSIWLISGNSPSTFFVRKVKPGVGCRSHHSIVNIGDVLLFLAEDGFYAFDGANADRIGSERDPIGPAVRGRNFARDRYCVGTYDFNGGAILWSFTSGSGAQNDSTYVYFPDNARRVGAPSWCLWNLGEVTHLALLTDSSTRQRELWFGQGDGYVCKSGGNNDNGSSIDFKWRTGRIDAGDWTRLKAWGELTLETAVQSSSSALTVRFLLDNDSSPTALFTHDQSLRAVGRHRVKRTSRDLRIEVYQSSTTPTEVDSFTLFFQPRGRA